MRVQIAQSRLDDEVLVFADWNHLEPYWNRNTLHPLDRHRLYDAYLDLWFDLTAQPPIFLPGLADLEDDPLTLYFTNGRHRTNLLVKHGLRIVPIWLFPDSVSQLKLSPVTVATPTIEIPDLPILTPTEMHIKSSS